MSKIDISHTVALKNRPHPDARLIRDLDTGEAVWEGVPEPEPVVPPPEQQSGLDLSDDTGACEPEPEFVEPEHTLHKPRHKKLHHG